LTPDHLCDGTTALRERYFPQESVWLMRQGETRAIALS
jgi:hypothetical protein